MLRRLAPRPVPRPVITAYVILFAVMGAFHLQDHVRLSMTGRLLPEAYEDPEEENQELGLHGRLAFLPAREVAAMTGWEGEEYVVRVRGWPWGPPL